MTGHEIAENLRSSKLGWTTGQLHRKNPDTLEDEFCVLGLKAFEAGVSIKRLDTPWRLPEELSLPISIVWHVNDSTYSVAGLRTKEAVADAFDSPSHRDVDYPIEAFIEWLKSH
jgi:hypothetical protein